jgi:hypothetical protein
MWDGAGEAIDWDALAARRELRRHALSAGLKRFLP